MGYPIPLKARRYSMSVLDGKIVPTQQLGTADKERMFSLMDMFFENMVYETFISDLEKKDYCIVLFDQSGVIQGFSTQQIIRLDVDGKVINGVFSGDTIVHKDFWKTRHPLFSVFGTFFERYSRDFEEFYWFLICKGYKTYKILPTFFNEFYPVCDAETPPELKRIIDAFGESYSGDYNSDSGVVEYQSTKDRLRSGVADVVGSKLNNKHTAFFVQKNPGHTLGHDLVCITSLRKHNYQSSKEAIIWG